MNIIRKQLCRGQRWLLVWLVLCCATGSTRADLVALYRFESSATNDVTGKLGTYSGNTYNGTAVGDAVALSTDVSGVNGSSKSLSLGGSSDYITLPISAVNPFDGSQSYTITCWFKHSDLAGNNVIILSSARDTSSGNHAMAFFLHNSPEGNLRTDNYFVNQNNVGSALDDNAWHFGAVTYEPGTGFRLRVDNTYSSTSNFDPAIPSISSDTVIIGDSLNTDFPTPGDFAGLLDDVAIFNHKLSDSELDAVKAGDFSAYVSSAPEMDVAGNGVSIASGDVTPVAADHTDFGSAVSGGGTITRTFTITNSGFGILNFTATPKVQISGAGASHFSVTQPSFSSGSVSIVNAGFELPSYSSGGWNYQGGYDFNGTPGVGWTFGTSAGIANNGSPWFVNAAPEGDQAAFIQMNAAAAFFSQAVNFTATGAYDISFYIVRRSSGYPGNDIDVRVDGVSVGTVLNTSQTSDTWVKFSFPYLCTSTGNHTLSFVGTRGGGDYDSAIDDVSIARSQSAIAPGESVNFQVQFAPTSTGVQTATVTIASDDSDEGTYTFDIQGTGAAAGSLAWTADTGNGNGSGNATADGLRIRLNGSSIEFSADGGTSWTASAPYATTTTLTLTGSNADDTFVIDYSGGDPIPSGGVVITGSGQVSAGDAITLTGGSHTTVTYGFVNNNDGSIDIDGSLITYTGLEPITDNSGAVNRVFDFTGGAESIAITSVSATQTKVDSTLGESVVFNNPTGSMTLNAGTGDDAIALDSLSSGWGATVTITLNGDAGDDQFGLSKTVATAAPITVNGGTHTAGDILSFGQEGDAGIVSSGASPGTLSGGTPSIQTVNYDTVETITLVAITLASGDIIVADRGPYFSTGTILFHNGTSQQVLSTTLKDPYEIALDADGHVVVADYEVDGSTAGIFRINKTSLLRTTISSGGSLEVPFGVKVATAGPHSGKYIVADLDADNNGAAEWGAIFVVDPGAASPGNQTLLSSRTTGTGTDFYWLTGLALGSAGDIYVCDQGNQASPGTQPPRIYHVDPATGNRTIMAEGGTMKQPAGLAVISGTGATAQLVVVDAGLKKLLRFTGTGAPIAITAGEELSHTGVTFDKPTHVAIDGSGDYVITDAPVGAIAGQRRLHRMNSGTLVTTTITTDGFLEQPRGVVVVP